MGGIFTKVLLHCDQVLEGFVMPTRRFTYICMHWFVYDGPTVPLVNSFRSVIYAAGNEFSVWTDSDSPFLFSAFLLVSV